MRQYPKNRFVPGDRKKSCPRCDFDFLQSELVWEEGTHQWVCQECYDPPHPQDEPKTKVPQPPYIQTAGG